MSKENSYPASANQLEPDFVKKTVSDLLEIQNYFRYCQQNGMRPGVEGLALCLGTTRQTLFNWKLQKGCTEERANMIKASLQFINATLESAFLSGKVNPVSGIFMLKNWAGYCDRTDIAINSSDNSDDLNDDESSIEALEKKYANFDITEKSE